MGRGESEPTTATDSIDTVNTRAQTSNATHPHSQQSHQREKGRKGLDVGVPKAGGFQRAPSRFIVLHTPRSSLGEGASTLNQERARGRHDMDAEHTRHKVKRSGAGMCSQRRCLVPVIHRNRNLKDTTIVGDRSNYKAGHHSPLPSKKNVRTYARTHPTRRTCVPS